MVTVKLALHRLYFLEKWMKLHKQPARLHAIKRFQFTATDGVSNFDAILRRKFIGIKIPQRKKRIRQQTHRPAGLATTKLIIVSNPAHQYPSQYMGGGGGGGGGGGREWASPPPSSPNFTLSAIRFLI